MHHAIFQTRVREIMMRRGLRMADVAKGANVKWSYLHKILTQDRPNLSAQIVRKIALALGVSTDYLMDMPSPQGETQAQDTSRAS